MTYEQDWDGLARHQAETAAHLPFHADTGDAGAASIRPGMGQLVASMRR
jgi:hypothetical protein